MARPPASPEQREAQRERIRSAAADLYREQGLHGVTMRAVAQRAEVATGTPYRYFDNLEALLQSLWTEPVAEAGRQLETLVAGLSEPTARIRALLDAYVAFARDRPDVHRGAVLFVRPTTLPTPAPDPVEELPLYRLLRAAVVAGQAEGSVRDGDADSIVRVLWAGVHGALALPINIDRFAVDPDDRLPAEMIDTLLGTIAVSANARS